MKTRTYVFKSILQKWKEIPQDEEEWASPQKEYDIESVREHRLELGARQIMTDRSWGSNFFVALMSAFALCALAYGLLVLGFGSAVKGALFPVFLTLSLMIFLALWVLFSIKGAVNNQKRKLVENERGKGEWIIVDSGRWEKFYGIITAPKDASADNRARQQGR